MSSQMREHRRSSIMEYEQSVLFGQYHEKLASFARLQSSRVKDQRARLRERKKNFVTRFILPFFMTIGNWPLLFFLGILISFASFLVDVATHALISSRTYLLTTISGHVSGFWIWTCHSVIMVMIAAMVTRYISPQAAGSGVAEMKVVIRGVVIKEYLSLRTLVAKLVGVPFVLASGLGVGKEGPFVHISSMITNQLFKIFGKVTATPNEYEIRFQELITIASAVGVAATFAAPIGSVLYSIEIVKSFFAVRSYWEGFFAATWGALLWRLFAVWFQIEENISHIMPTHFDDVFPYETLEICLFALLGIFCGLASFVFVQLQRAIVKLNRRKSIVSSFLNKAPLVYPLVISFLIGALKYPGGFGQYTSSYMTMEQTIHDLYSNFTWHTADVNKLFFINQSHHEAIHQMHVLKRWTSSSTDVFTNTLLFFLCNFITVAVASTVPVPGGLIVPLFMIGAGFGRLFGEVAAFLFPHNLNPFEDVLQSRPIVAGAYAVAASAAMCGGVTGSLSVAVVAFEITGQLTHFLPIIICVGFANLVSRYLGPTTYESTIELKNLPFLPTMIKATAISHKVLVEDFMDTDVQFVWNGCTYEAFSKILSSNNILAFYPFVSSPDSRFLLGVIHHLEIRNLFESHLNRNSLKVGKVVNSISGPGADGGKDNQRATESTGQVTLNGRFQIKSNSLVKGTAVNASELWNEKLKETVDFSRAHIDPAPLQIMEGTPLSNVHNLFSLLSLQVVYVTSLGRLTGVVTLKDLRRVIENVEKGILPACIGSAHTGGVIDEEDEPLKEEVHL